MADSELDDYCRDYPLSARWTRPVLLRHVAHIGETAIHLVGLTAADASGQCAVGSAGVLSGSPLERAYFELVERTSVLEALTSDEAFFPVRNASGESVGTVSKCEAFPQSPDDRHYTYARSNGVAVGTHWEGASRRAEFELLERDRVLRSWYGGSAPERIDLPGHLVPESLGAQFELEAYLLPEHGGAGRDVVVSAVFGFPRNAAVPLVFGFGARHTELDSLSVAACECLQRLGFLWGEAIPIQPPKFAQTPDFHQDHYLFPPHQVRLRAWLRGEHESSRGLLPDALSERPSRRFVDLTPRALRSELVVVKALPCGELPLTFGYGHPALSRVPPEQLAIHPIT